MNTIAQRFSILGLLLVFGPACVKAGIFDDAENLKVLPKETTSAELRATMRGFSMATGHRCEGCHVGEAGQPLDAFDFPSDDKDTKKIAREMYKMVKDINARMASELGDASTPLIKVECMTCHRGQNKPQMLDDLLVNLATEESIVTSANKYRELRKSYYGSHTFDFSEGTLINVAERVVKEHGADAAMVFLNLNLEFNPASWQSYVGQSQILARAGNATAAKEKLQKALDIMPDNPHLQRMMSEFE